MTDSERDAQNEHDERHAKYKRLAELEVVVKDLLGTLTICQQQRQWQKGERRRSWDQAFLDSEMQRSIANAAAHGIEWNR